MCKGLKGWNATSASPSPLLLFPSLCSISRGLHLHFQHRRQLRPSVHCHRSIRSRRRRRFQSQCPWPMVSPARARPPLSLPPCLPSFPSPTPTSKVCHNLDDGRPDAAPPLARQWMYRSDGYAFTLSFASCLDTTCGIGRMSIPRG